MAEMTVKEFAKKVGYSYCYVSNVVKRVYPKKRKGGKGRLLSTEEQEYLMSFIQKNGKKNEQKDSENISMYSKDFWINPYLEDDDDGNDW